MNNKTVVAVLVIILVVLAGVGLSKYAKNVELKQQAAGLESQMDQEFILEDEMAEQPLSIDTFAGNFGPVSATMIDEEEVYYTYPNGKSAPSCAVQVTILPPLTSTMPAAPGNATGARFQLIGCASNDVKLNSVGFNLDYDSNAGPSTLDNFRYDFTQVKDVTTGQLIQLGPLSSPVYYNYPVPGGIIIPAGSSHTFELLGAFEGDPAPTNRFTTYIADMDVSVPSMANVPAVFNIAFPSSIWQIIDFI